MSGDLTYVPPGELGPVAVGDQVQVVDRNGNAFQSGNQRIVKVRPTYVQTECGRKWTKERGEWIGEFRGNRAISYPFPSIRASCRRCDSFHESEQLHADCRGAAKAVQP